MATETDKEQVPSPFQEIERALGQALQAMSQSPLHANKPLKELYEQLLPALATRQYRVVLNKEGQTVAYISWALVSEAVEQKLQEAGGKLELSDWQSGEIGMLIDVVVKNPTAGNELVKLRKDDWNCGKRKVMVDEVGLKKAGMV